MSTYKRHYTKQIMERMLIRYGGDMSAYRKENMTKVEIMIKSEAKE